LKIIKLNATTSTNSYLKELIRELPSEEPMVVWAESQTLGRGQRGASWSSQEGASLTFSMFLKFSERLNLEPIAFNFAVSLGIVSALDAFKIPELMVKWPNDILSDEKKLCGILIENQWQRDKPVSAIVGIGLNVNESEFTDLPKATSMKIMAKKTFDRKLVLETIVNEIEKQITKAQTMTLDTFIKCYEDHLFRKDRISVFQSLDGSVFNGIILGVNASGYLSVRLESDEIINYDLKEVKLMY